MTDTYHVLLPIGSEGPFSCEELRNRLATGKVRSSDRVMHALTRKVCALTDVLPDAGDASKARAPVSERIRRSNSDRHAAAQAGSQRIAATSPALTPSAKTSPASTISSISLPAAGLGNALREAPTTSARQFDAQIPSPTPTPEVKAPAPIVKGPRNPIPAFVVLIAVMLTLAWIWWPVSMSGTKMSLNDLAGTWKGQAGKNSALSGLTVRVDQGSVTVTDTNGVRSAQTTLVVAGEDVIVLRLMPADPHLGQMLQFNRSERGLSLITKRGQISLGSGSQ